MDAKKIKSDIIIYLLLLAGCFALYFWITPEQIAVNTNLMGNSDFTPRTFPNLLTGGIALVSAIGLITSAVKYARLDKAARKSEKKPLTRQDVLALLIPYLIFAVIAGWCAIFERAGYIWSAVIAPPVMMLLFGCRKWYYYLIVYGFAAAMYLLFKFALRVPLP